MLISTIRVFHCEDTRASRLIGYLPLVVSMAAGAMPGPSCDASPESIIVSDETVLVFWEKSEGNDAAI